MYTERLSPSTGAVLWTRTAEVPTSRIVPDGCSDLIWSDGSLLVAGPDTRAHLASGEPGTRYVGLRFPPGRGTGVLGVPASELRDQRVPLDGIWPDREVRRIAEQVAAAGDPGRALEAAITARRDEVRPADAVCAAIVVDLERGVPVSVAAAAVGIGVRQLHRRCLTAFGYGPKTLARVLRLNKALRLARGATPFAEVAVGAGYADQAHLAREVRALAGVPLGTLLDPQATGSEEG